MTAQNTPSTTTRRPTPAQIQAAEDVSLAIEYATLHFQSVTMRHTPEREEALLVECEGSDEGDFWGTSEDGAEWRVRLV